LPLAAGSAVGGWLARVVGPRLARHETARENIELALPELSPEQVDQALKGMWDNFGRTAAEFAHLPTFQRASESEDEDSLVTFAGMENLEALKKDYRGAIFVGGHIGNWELTALILHRMELETVVVYRPPDTPYVDRLVRRQRSLINPELAVKREDVKTLVTALREKRSVSMMVDQKLWQGEILPFFGHDAQTTTMPAKLALRYGLPLVPLRCERLDGVHFRVTAYAPILPPEGGAKGEAAEKAELALTIAINQVLEGWIRERPDQWHWLHRRWDLRRPRRYRWRQKRENG
jgi:KDO2-lipid IV(A) lauroyltransferase